MDFFSSKRVYFLPLGALNITKEGGMIMKHNFDKIIEILKYVAIILSLIVIIKSI